MNYDPIQIVSVIIIIFFGVGLHEYAHCKFAELAGDPTPRFYGRVTLDLTKHFEPTGTIMMVISSLSGFGLGWGRPAPMNPEKMRNPRWDFMIAVLAGPLSNVVQAVVWALMFRFLTMTGQVSIQDLFDEDGSRLAMFFLLAVQINLSMAAFNMIPLGPLDGHWILGTFLPEKARYYWYRWNREVGRTALIVLIVGTQFLARQNPSYDILGRYLGKVVIPPTLYLLGIHQQ